MQRAELMALDYALKSEESATIERMSADMAATFTTMYLYNECGVELDLYWIRRTADKLK